MNIKINNCVFETQALNAVWLDNNEIQISLKGVPDIVGIRFNDSEKAKDRFEGLMQYISYTEI